MSALPDSLWKRGTVPLFVWLAGCASAPPPAPAPVATPAPVVATEPESATQSWDGGGGIASPSNRGAALADLALRLRGVPYRYGGATREGFDCSGLVFFTHRQLGVVVPRTSRDQSQKAVPVNRRHLHVGDLVFFKIGGSRVNHVGIYIGDGRFVHAPGAGKPVTIGSLDDDFYARTFASAGRFWDGLPQ